MTIMLDRRAVLRVALLTSTGLGAGALASCSSATTPVTPPATAPTTSPTGREAIPSGSPTRAGARVLLVYFSRAGENYHYGGRRNLTTGNTAVVAQLIRDRLGCDSYRIEAAEPYPTGYTPTVDRNTREQQADARPAIADSLPDVSVYDTLLVGSPVWGSRAPMIMNSFFEGVDLSGKLILPFVTYAVSGLSGIPDAYAALAPNATVGEALAVRGEEVGTAGLAVDQWLRRSTLIAR